MDVACLFTNLAVLMTIEALLRSIMSSFAFSISNPIEEALDSVVFSPGYDAKDPGLVEPCEE
jgi:hypothetical protein